MLVEALLTKATIDGEYYTPGTQQLIAICIAIATGTQHTPESLIGYWLDEYELNPIDTYQTKLQVRLDSRLGLEEFMGGSDRMEWGVEGCIRALPLGLLEDPVYASNLAGLQAKVTHAHDYHLCAPAYALATYIARKSKTSVGLGVRLNTANPGYSYDEPLTLPAPEAWGVMRGALTYLNLCTSQTELLEAIQNAGGAGASNTALVAVWLSCFLDNYTKDLVARSHRVSGYHDILEYMELDRCLGDLIKL